MKEPSNGCPIVDRDLSIVERLRSPSLALENVGLCITEFTLIAEVLEELRDKCIDLREWGNFYKAKYEKSQEQLETSNERIEILQEAVE